MSNDPNDMREVDRLLSILIEVGEENIPITIHRHDSWLAIKRGDIWYDFNLGLEEGMGNWYLKNPDTED